MIKKTTDEQAVLFWAADLLYDELHGNQGVYRYPLDIDRDKAKEILAKFEKAIEALIEKGGE